MTAPATRASRRWVLKGLAGSTASALLTARVPFDAAGPASAGSAVEGPEVSVADYGTTTADIQAALEAAAGGALVFDPGVVYTLAAPLVAPSNVRIRGNGATLRYPDDATFEALLAVVGRRNVVVSGLTFDGNVAGQTVWSQYRHAIRVLDSSDVEIRDNRFLDPIGDGVYVGRAVDAPPPFVGSDRVSIHHNRFLGDNSNRNGVSLICGRRIRIHDNSFFRMGRPDMPGAIDLEPNEPEEFLQDVRIFANTIDAGDGPVTARFGISYYDVSGAPVGDVSIRDNTIVGPNLAFGVLLSSPEPRGTGFTVQGNDIRNLTGARHSVGIYVEGGLRVSVTSNKIDAVTGYGVHGVGSCLILDDNAISGVSLEDVRKEDPAC